MTTATAPTWTEATHTGRSALALLLTAPVGNDRDRCLWNLFHRAFPAAIQRLAGPSGALVTTLTARQDASEQDIIRLRVARRGIASDLYETLARDLWHTSGTLAAIAAGAPNPIHGSDRASLSGDVARVLNLYGAASDDLTVRRLTDAAISDLSAALADLVL